MCNGERFKMSQKELFRDEIIRNLEDLMERNIPQKAKEQLEDITNALEEINLES